MGRDWRNLRFHRQPSQREEEALSSGEQSVANSALTVRERE
jgi:hypothetical protein